MKFIPLILFALLVFATCNSPNEPEQALNARFIIDTLQVSATPNEAEIHIVYHFENSAGFVEWFTLGLGGSSIAPIPNTGLHPIIQPGQLQANTHKCPLPESAITPDSVYVNYLYRGYFVEGADSTQFLVADTVFVAIH